LNMQTNSDETSAQETTSSQSLTPLFGVALVLTAVGFYLAFSGQGDVAAGTKAANSIAALDQVEALEVPDEVVDTSVEAVELVHGETKPHAVDLTLRQNSWLKGGSGEEDSLETVLKLGLEEEVSEVDATRFEGRPRVLSITRHYERASARVTTGDGQSIGPGITSQVEALVRGSITRMYVAPSGEPLEFEWREVPNPQARRMLFLVRDAHTFLTPRFVAGAVNPGDTWSYERPMVVEEPELGVTADGTVAIDNRFVGVVTDEDRRFGVVRQRIEASVEGGLKSEDANARFRVEGSGQGVVIVDLEAGRVHAADVDFERTLTVASGGGEPTVQVSEISLGLRPADGLALPEFRKQKHQDGHKLEASKDHTQTQ
jgi:hypothetical protein